MSLRVILGVVFVLPTATSDAIPLPVRRPYLSIVLTIVHSNGTSILSFYYISLLISIKLFKKLILLLIKTVNVSLNLSINLVNNLLLFVFFILLSCY